MVPGFVVTLHFYENNVQSRGSTLTAIITLNKGIQLFISSQILFKEIDNTFRSQKSGIHVLLLPEESKCLKK